MTFKNRVMAGVIAGILAGCGGGGSSDSSKLTLSGTAATGLAIANAPVSAKCQSGTASATTRADGSFSLSISGGSLPCVLEVSGADKTLLHSIIHGNGTSATVNITPLSDLMVARLAGQTPAEFFNAFDPSKINANTVADAQQAVVKALKDVVDLSGMDLLSDKLQAANGGNAGNAFDQKLDAFKAKLAAANISLATLLQAMADNSSASTDGAGSVIATLLQPSAASCAALRSGKYRVITPGHTDPAWEAEVSTFDASTGNITYHDGSTATASAVANSACEFSSGGGLVRLYYSKSGIAVINNGAVAPRRISVAFPEQALTLADLAGTWNQVSFKRPNTSSPLIFSHGILKIDASGGMSKFDCQQALSSSGCGTAAANGSFAIPSSGAGFVFTPSTGDTTPRKAFAYRAPNGTMAMVMLEPNNNGWSVATLQAAATLPNVGDVSKYWAMNVSSSNVATAATEQVATIVAVDTANHRYTRQFQSTGHTDVLSTNNPYTGLTYRPPQSSTATDNTPILIEEYIALTLRGMGISVYGKPIADNTSFFGIRIDKP
jgi:hypothetical protein